MSTVVIDRTVATVNDCVSTTAETTVFSVVIAANTFADGNTAAFVPRCVSRNSSGASKDLTLRIKATDTATPPTTQSTNVTTVTAPNNANEGKSRPCFSMERVGGDLWLTYKGSGGIDSGFPMQPYTVNLDNFGNTSGAVFSGLDFSTDITIELTAQWTGANASTYFNCESGFVDLVL